MMEETKYSTTFYAKIEPYFWGTDIHGFRVTGVTQKRPTISCNYVKITLKVPRSVLQPIAELELKEIERLEIEQEEERDE